MSVIKGLKNIKAFNEEREAARAAREENANRPKTQWFKLTKDGQQVKVIFLQELDEDSPNYSAKNGLAVLAIEHNNPAPNMWMRKALCTADEGACWACEQHQADYKAGWKQKIRFYGNVLVDDGENEPYVALLSQGNGAKSITPTLLDYAMDDGTVSDKWFNLKRNGLKLDDTSYVLRAGKPHDLNLEEYELFDLDAVLRKVPYEQQEAHYLDGGKLPKKEAAATPATSAEVDLDW